MPTGVLESHSSLRVPISVSYPDFNSPRGPPLTFLHDGSAFTLHFLCYTVPPVLSLYILKPEDPGYGLGSFVVLRCWLSGEAVTPQTCSLRFVLVLGGESEADTGYLVRIFRCIRAAPLTVSIGDGSPAVVS